MKTDKYGRVSITENEAFDAIYSNKSFSIENINLDSVDAINQFNRARSINADSFSDLKVLSDLDITVEDFDCINHKNWFIPAEYKNLNIAEWLLGQCKTETETQRVLLELEMFIQHNMIEVLQYLKYLVDTMRKNNIVWGVGRGSSVASYCLYLIGVHKVNSLKFDLDITEFLR